MWKVVIIIFVFDLVEIYFTNELKSLYIVKEHTEIC